jgi:polyphenol oxidase
MVMTVLYNLCLVVMQSVASSAPVPADGFEWVAAPWGRQLVAHALKDFRHGWTTRQLQLRGSRDVERAGWAQIAEAADVQPAAVLRMHQVHGVAVHRASAADIGTPPHEADVIRTDDHEIALAVQVADCVPLLLGDPPSGRIAAAHAGWRGTASNAAGVAAAEFDTGDDGRASLVAVLGPSIGPCCYRVGPEVRTSFEGLGWAPSLLDRWFSLRAGAFSLDLWQANVDQLLAAGIAARNIHVCRLCTACHPEWLCSYRREGPGTGRMAGYIRSAKC